jgi:glycosyltransferase involved in cell wall biosynthesis
MQAEPFFTIIVPTYNRGDLIAATLRTLQQQTYPGYEIIVVDDGSTDNTEEVVRSVMDARTQYVKKPNGERAAARNYGASLAKGDYVNFFDSDDLALDNHVAVAAETVKLHARPEWFHLGYEWADPEGNVFRKVDGFTGDTLNGIIAGGNPLSCNGVFLRKDVAMQHRFNEDRALSASEDYELWCRLAARFPLYYSNTITSQVVDHEFRSVRVINGEKLIQRLKLLVHYLEKDPEVQQYFGAKFSHIKMDSYSYIALHLAEQVPFKGQSIGYLLKAFATAPRIVGRRRFYAVIKNILLKW